MLSHIPILIQNHGRCYLRLRRVSFSPPWCQQYDDIFLSPVSISKIRLYYLVCNIILSVIMSVLPTMWLTIDLSHQGQAVGHLAKRKTQKSHIDATKCCSIFFIIPISQDFTGWFGPHVSLMNYTHTYKGFSNQ